MELHIARELKNLRKRRDLTQEELANILGVTPQAVSKWERGEGCPDVALLPGIAVFFGVSLDELFGMAELRGRARLEEYHARWKACNDAGENERGVRLMREALREYPGESLLTVQLVVSLEKCDGSAEKRAQNRAEAIALSERLARDDDPEIRNAFLFNICHSWWKNGETARAVEGARKLPNAYKTRENALVMFLEGGEKLRQGREGVGMLAGSLFHQGLAMASACEPAEAIALLQSCCDAARALYPRDDIPELLRQQATAYLRMAEAALCLDQRDDALKYLHRCVELALRSREAPAGPCSFLAEGLDTPPVSAAAFRRIGLHRLREDAVFAPLADDPAFRELQAMASISSPPGA